MDAKSVNQCKQKKKKKKNNRRSTRMTLTMSSHKYPVADLDSSYQLSTTQLTTIPRVRSVYQ